MMGASIALPRRTSLAPSPATPMKPKSFSGPQALRRCAAAWVPLMGLLLVAFEDGTASWYDRGAAALPCALLLPFLCLGFWWAAEMNPVHSAPDRRLWLTHAAGAMTGSAIWFGLSLTVVRAFSAPDSVPSALLLSHRTWLLLLGVIAYLIVLLVHSLLAAQRAGAAESLRREESLRLTREAELAALRLQIHPHFLFNALHSISALTTLQPSRARDMTVRLADFLRRNLRLGDRPTVTLTEELELVHDYLALEELRFGERLQVVTEIGPGLDHALLPPLLLQPLVENAVKHGLSSLTGPMTLELTARREGNELVLAVENDHDSDAATEQLGTGLGLTNTRERLARVRGDNRGLAVTEEGDRFRVELRLPFEAGRS